MENIDQAASTEPSSWSLAPDPAKFCSKGSLKQTYYKWQIKHSQSWHKSVLLTVQVILVSWRID